MFEPIAILVAGALTAWAALYQIGNQARLKLKLEIYREILSVRERQGDAERDLSTKLHILQSQIDIWLHPNRFGGFSPKPNVSAMELNQLMHIAMTEIANLVILTEQWQIIDPRFDLFRTALNAAAYDVRTSFIPFFATATRVLSSEAGASSNHAAADADLLTAMKVESAKVIEALSRADAWASDYAQQMQILLLAGLFKNRVPPRQPIDPASFAVTLDRYDELTAFFQKESNWGRHVAMEDEKARKRVAEGPNSQRSRE